VVCFLGLRLDSGMDAELESPVNRQQRGPDRRANRAISSSLAGLFEHGESCSALVPSTTRAGGITAGPSRIMFGGAAVVPHTKPVIRQGFALVGETRNADCRLSPQAPWSWVEKKCCSRPRRTFGAQGCERFSHQNLPSLNRFHVEGCRRSGAPSAVWVRCRYFRRRAISPGISVSRWQFFFVPSRLPLPSLSQ